MNLTHPLLNTARGTLTCSARTICLNMKPNWMVCDTARHLEVAAQRTGESHEN